jgi:hypothetical protein
MRNAALMKVDWAWPARRFWLWAALAVAALAVTAAVSGASVYLLGRRDDGVEKARALADAAVVSFDHKWSLQDAMKVAPQLWLASYMRHDGSTSCVLIDVNRFVRVRHETPLGFAGADPVRCYG